MFKTLNNIDKSFRAMRAVVIVTLIICGITVVAVVFRTTAMIAAERQKIYVLDGGKSLILALQQDLAINRPVELRNHVRMFHELFFTLAPDAEVINRNIGRALALADRSAHNYFTDWNEGGFYRRIIANNIIQRIEIDSMDVNVDVYPYRVMVYARQLIQRQSNMTTRNLVTTMQVVESQRSDNNPHGFIIQNFVVVNNDYIETVTLQ